jgi:SpoIID/LytB domain protein
VSPIRSRLLVVLAVMATMTTGLGAAPAGGATCPDPARTPDPFDTLVHHPDYPNQKDADDGKYTVQLDASRTQADADNPYEVVLNGGGYGHGVGMSQYGARGAAEQGCTAEQILTTYFPGTALGTQDDGAYSVSVYPEKPGQNGAQVFGIRSRGTSVLSWYLDGALLAHQAPESGTPEPWYVCAHEGGGFTLRTTSTCSGESNYAIDGVTWPIGGANSLLTIDLEPDVHIAQATYNARRFARGTLTFRSRTHSGADTMSVTIRFTSIQPYLYGLGEVPSSWPTESLKAQAILARAYAVTSNRDKTGSGDGTADDCDCRIYPSTFDQAYVGWDKEDPAVQGSHAASWRAAVDATATSVLTYDFDDDQTPKVIRGFYSSSHGGISADPYQVWGTDPNTFPYLQSVNTSAWEDYGASKNHLHRWSRGYSSSELASKFGLDMFTSIEITTVEPGGRPTRSPKGAVVRGIKDEQEVELTFSGEELRSKLGLHSGLVTIEGAPAPMAAPTWVRRFGTGRVETAVDLSLNGWGSSEHVLLARADHPADALAGSSLAGSLDAPLLLTGTDALPDDVRAEIERLGATTVWILGGEASVGPAVVATLQDEMGLTVERVSGPNRFATAAEIGKRLLDVMAESRTAYIIRAQAETPGKEWADALAVSGIAARRGKGGIAFPILGVSDTLPDPTRQALTDLEIQRVVAVGGSGTVPDSVLDEIAAMGIAIDERLAGSSRWGTSRAVAQADSFDETALVIATGENFPDGLAAGPYAARTNAALLLVPTAFVDGQPWGPEGHDDYIAGLTMVPSVVVVAGGPNSVNDEVAEHVLGLRAH